MKKYLLLLIICLIVFTGCEKKVKPVYLEDEYYDNNKIVEIDGSKLKELEEDKKSFVVFVHLPYCSMLACFEPVLEEFVDTNNITFYSVLSTTIDDTKLSDEVKHFPTVAIYDKGEIIAYLDAKSDDDLKYYKNISDFTEWASKYIYLSKN